MPVIMGRKSFESLKKALPGRINIVVNKKKIGTEGCYCRLNSIDDAIEKAKESDAKEIFIIGGGEIFKQTIDIVSRIYLHVCILRLKMAIHFILQLMKDKWKIDLTDHFLQMKSITMLTRLKYGKKIRKSYNNTGCILLFN